jgi:hypothetical protein
VRIAWHEKNGLERELATYDTVSFPLRPPQHDEAYEKRRLESAKRRKLKHMSDSANASANGSDEGAADMSCGDDTSTYQYEGETLGDNEEGNDTGHQSDNGVQEDFVSLFSHQLSSDVNTTDNYDEVVTEIVELSGKSNKFRYNCVLILCSHFAPRSYVTSFRFSYLSFSYTTRSNSNPVAF